MVQATVYSGSQLTHFAPSLFLSFADIETVSDHLKEGEEVRVKVLDVDQRGRIKLSIKELLEDEADEVQEVGNA